MKQIRIHLEAKVTMSKQVLVQVPDEFECSQEAMERLARKTYQASLALSEKREENNFIEAGWSEEDFEEGSHQGWPTKHIRKATFELVAGSVIPIERR